MKATPSDLPARARAAAAALGCSRAESIALALLASGTVAALAMLWILAGGAAPGGSAEPALHPAEPADGRGVVVELDEAEIVVHVAGRVSRPGLQRLPAGARVADALEAAGGPAADAVLDALNLARPLQDGEQILVAGAPGGAEPDDGQAPRELPQSALRADGTLDLNRATATELETLPGIGPVMAQRIVEHREQQGPFTVLGDLRQVRGIGEKTFQSLVDLLSL